MNRRKSSQTRLDIAKFIIRNEWTSRLKQDCESFSEKMEKEKPPRDGRINLTKRKVDDFLSKICSYQKTGGEFSMKFRMSVSLLKTHYSFSYQCTNMAA